MSELTRTSDPQPERVALGTMAWTVGRMGPGGSRVLSLRVDAELLDRIAAHAARRGMSVQDYVVQTLVRDDFDERYKAAVQATERFYAG